MASVENEIKLFNVRCSVVHNSLSICMGSQAIRVQNERINWQKGVGIMWVQPLFNYKGLRVNNNRQTKITKVRNRLAS